jgi:hypothetical protein
MTGRSKVLEEKSCKRKKRKRKEKRNEMKQKKGEMLLVLVQLLQL